MDVEDFVSRLEGARGRNGSWVARCPAHRDRSPSLTVRGLPDGRILLHCFAGCETAAVLEAMGLTFGDLFPQKLGEFRRERPAFTALEALRALTHESSVIALCASEVADGRPLSAEDAARARVAAGRIATALEFVHGRY